MANIVLTDQWQEVNRIASTSPATGLQVTVILYARYNPAYRTATETRVEQKCTIDFGSLGFTGIWCNGGGHYQGAYYQYPGWPGPEFRWEDMGTFRGDGSTRYENLFTDYWTVQCTDGYALLEVFTRWVYPYYGWTAQNTQFGAIVELPRTFPSGLQGSNVVPGTNSFTADVSITAWNGGSSSSRYLELCAWTIGQTTPRRWEIVHGDSLSQTITVDNDSPWTTTPPLTISPNTTYTLTVYATNGSESTGSQNIGDYTTLAPAPTIALDSVTETTATFSWSTVADGGALAKTIEYSLDGSTWSTGATVSTGSASSGTFTITGLSAGTTYNVQTRITSTAGSTTGSTVTVTTTAPVTNANLYGSVNGNTKKVIKLYGSVLQTIPTGVTGTIRSGGAGNVTTFDGSTFWSYASSSLNSTAVDYLRVQCDGQDYRLSVSYTDGTATQSLYGWGSASGLTDYGITIPGNVMGDDYIDLTVVTSQVQATKRIVKLYGPVNGSSKLIYEDSNV